MSQLSNLRLWISSVVLIALLIMGAAYIVQDQWRKDMQDAHQVAGQEVELLGSLVKNDLRIGNYQDSVLLMNNWGRRNADVVSLLLTADNDFVIGEYQRAEKAARGKTVEKQVEIVYSYTGKANLTLRKDLAPLIRHRRELIGQLGAAILLVAALLLTILRLLFLHRVEAHKLKHRTEELDQANTALTQEIEQRYQAETEKDRLLSILGATTDLVGIADIDGRILYLNRAGRKMTGIGETDTENKEIKILHPQWARDIIFSQGLPVAVEKGSWSGETALLNERGEEFPVSQVILSHKDRQGRVLYYSTIMRDITGMREAEAALKHANEELEARVRQRTEELLKAAQEAERANQAKSDFLSRMSHELRTPMNAILGFSQILEFNDNDRLGDDEMQYVEEILKGGRHLLELINEVLDLSRVESGKMQISIEAVQLDEVVRESVNLIRPLAENKDVSIKLPEKEIKVFVKADRMRLKQVMLNLLSNAVKYNRRHGRVEVRCVTGENHHRLCVSDTGPGIPESMRHRVFNPFDRLDVNTAEVEGTGIGLALAKRLVEYMGGSLDFDTVEGEGSTFCIELDACGDVCPETLPQSEAAEEGVVATAYNVLYVEDNPANLRLMKTLLRQRRDIQLYDAHNAELAIELAQINQFDLILLDINLAGGSNGYEVLAKLRAETATRHIPVVAVTANIRPHEIERGLAAGFQDYLTKPIDVDRFNNLIERYLQPDSQPPE